MQKLSYAYMYEPVTLHIMVVWISISCWNNLYSVETVDLRCNTRVFTEVIAQTLTFSNKKTVNSPRKDILTITREQADVQK